MSSRTAQRATVAVLAVMFLSAVFAGLIGQYNDGPLGFLPAWLGAASWFTFLATVPVLLVLLAYLVFRSVRDHRRTPGI